MRPVPGAVLLSIALAAPCAAADAPPWLKQVAASAARPGNEHAVVLLEEAQLTVTADGKLRTVRRFAVRIVSADGRRAAALRHVYLNPGGRVKRLRGWMIRGSGDTREIGDEHVVDLAAVDNDIYNEVRVRAIAAPAAAGAGDVFGAELEAEERLLFAQVEWSLQDRWPVRVARRSLQLPAGWTATSVTFNGPPVQPAVQGGTHVWEVRDLPAIDAERGMPPVSAVAVRVAVSFFGPPGARQAGQFETWDDVSAWLQALSAAAPSQGEHAAARAREITQGIAGRLDRVRAIAHLVQRIQYVSIQTGLGRGGGYQPRPADLVLAKQYGDCKDKASLMRAMLGAIGITSHLVAIFAGDRSYVREQWPSPQQFNHVILAIALDEAPPETTAIDHATLGRLLVFDPTDEHTPLGELPLHEQGSLALVVAPRGGLRRMPVAAADRHGILREIDAAVDARGGLHATMRETLKGHDAAARRAMRQALDAAAYKEHVERRLAEALPGARVARLQTVGDRAHEMQIESEVSFASFAQHAGTLMIAKPLAGYDSVLPLPDGKRQYPYFQNPIRREELVRLTLPPGFVVEEMPKPLTLSGAFGRYQLAYSEESGKVVARRSLELPLMTVDAARQPELRRFLDQVRAADASPVVLRRQ